MGHTPYDDMKKILVLFAAASLALPMSSAQPAKKLAKAKKEVKASKTWNH